MRAETGITVAQRGFRRHHGVAIRKAMPQQACQGSVPQAVLVMNSSRESGCPRVMPRVHTMWALAEFRGVAIQEGPARSLPAVQKTAFGEIGECGQTQPWQVAKWAEAATLDAILEFSHATAHHRYGDRQRHAHRTHEAARVHDEP
jgi:hypothetical protein